jgi:valyl-tRNA synthetase
MSLADLPKQYDPKAAQDRWYALWLEKGYFHATADADRKPYCIVIPPPNVTGALHLGHALNNTLQDILIRWRRMQGYDALWMPGTDHAGIATQAVVEKRLLEEEKKTRHDIGRDALVQRIWNWKDEYEARILSQLRLMGCSCDWERTRFTLDDVCARAVRETFFRLFRAGKIFRGKRLVNWDAQLRTAVADDEIYTEDTPGHIWTIRYPVSGSTSGEALHVATTRPETMLGDTAVAVHPDDPRYKHLIGKTVDLPLTSRQIPVIGDGLLVDPAFGTGCVKVTPAHDPNDYAAGVRNGLPMINLLNPDGTYNENAPEAYRGLDRIVVRKRVLKDLEAAGYLERVASHLVPLKHSDRSKTAIEPYLSDQWFVRMGDDPDGTPGFAQQAIDAVTSGRLTIHPERYAKSYIDWLGEKRDWCVSRQLWWGHRIPVWHKARVAQGAYELTELPKRLEQWKEEGRVAFGNRRSEDGAPEDVGDPALTYWFLCVKDESDREIVEAIERDGLFVQDPDVLDTWFSSALWPHSTLGWPEENAALKKFYPTSVLSTARDIITLWVARMVIFGQFNMGDVPFRDVYIHPVILDGKGERMSKSKGNGVDPVDIIDLYGADALRFGLASLATETQDIRMPVEKVKLPDGRQVNSSERFELARPFANKFWNAARLVLMNLEGYDPDKLPADDFAVTDYHADFWILSRLHTAARETTAALDRFAFADAARGLRDFTWNDFCDWYLEFAKPGLRHEHADSRRLAQNVAITVLDGLCRLLHPIMPFVTEQVWQALNGVAPRRPDPTTLRIEPAAESVCIAAWPVYHDAFAPRAEVDAVVAQWQEKVTALRTLRAERGVAEKAKIHPILVATGKTAEALAMGGKHIKALTGAESLQVVESVTDRPADVAVAVLPDAEILLPLAGLIDTAAEAARQKKQLADIEKQVAGLKGKLSNEGFVSRAPAEVVAQQRARLEELEGQRMAVEALLKSLTQAG